LVKTIPAVQLTIIGDEGPYEETLRKQFLQYGVDSHVKFVATFDPLKIEAILCKCAIGLAPYYPMQDTTKRFTDVTKPKVYMSCGLPVVITSVPPIAKEIELNGAGVVAEYDAGMFANAIAKLLLDRDCYRQCRENAIRMAQELSWERVFSKAFVETMTAWGNTA
jgi:glycosyltransferase involved in cell wall biosynthesis